MPRHFLQLHDAGGVQRRHAVQALDGRPRWPGAGIDENPVRGQLLAVDFQQLWTDEVRFAHDDRYARFANAPLTARPEAFDDVPLALADLAHVDVDRPARDPVIGAAARQIRHAGTCDHGLGRGAAFVDARSADVLSLDQCGTLTRLRQRGAERPAALARSNNNCVVGCGHLVSMRLSGVCSRRLAINDVQPVWWLAPTPRPVSP